ncbi:MAG: hypothetical protein INR71_10990 [Terriglobus roseus]|nr:hypothetical protein [Terriglobus roseus]
MALSLHARPPAEVEKGAGCTPLLRDGACFLFADDDREEVAPPQSCQVAPSSSEPLCRRA